MRLIEKQIKANPETFAPELLVTVALPIEFIDPSNLNESQSQENIGSEFVDLLKTKLLSRDNE